MTTGTIETLVEPTSEIIITPEMVSDFYFGSHDWNKIHQGENAIALGKQMAGMLRDFGDYQAARQRPGFDCSERRIEFQKAVRVGSKVELYFPEGETLKPEGENYVLKVAMRIKGQTEPRAVATLTYSPQLPSATNGEGGIEYLLTENDATLVARGIGKQGTDAQLLAYSLASNTLSQHGRELINLADSYGFLPVYGLHELHPHSAIREVKLGDRIRIITNAKKIADRLVRQIQKIEKEAEEKKEGLDARTEAALKKVEAEMKSKIEEKLQSAKAIVQVEAVNQNRQIMYNGRLVLVLKKPEDILRDAA